MSIRCRILKVQRAVVTSEVQHSLDKVDVYTLRTLGSTLAGKTEYMMVVVLPPLGIFSKLIWIHFFGHCYSHNRIPYLTYAGCGYVLYLGRDALLGRRLLDVRAAVNRDLRTNNQQGEISKKGATLLLEAHTWMTMTS